MLEFVVTSTNQKKIEATRRVIDSVLEGSVEFTVKGCQAESGVSDQPLSVEETKRGAINRIFNAKCDADFIVSIESGVEREFDTFYSFTFAVIGDKSRTRFGYGTSTKFQVPDHVAYGLEQGKTLGEINHSPEGLIANVTGNRMKRTDLIAEAVMVALSFFHFYPTAIPPGVPKELLAFQDTITPIERNSLASQLSQLDFHEPAVEEIPAEVATPVSDEMFIETAQSFEKDGKRLVKEGKLAFVLFAGQPNLIALNIVNGKTQLERHLNSIIEIERSCCRGNPRLHVMVVTSEATHSAIATYLMKYENFGLKNLVLVKQRSLPARTKSGQCVLRSCHEVLDEPIGNGSLFDLLASTRLIMKLEAGGVSFILSQSVTNAKPLPSLACLGSIASTEFDAVLFAEKDPTLSKPICAHSGKPCISRSALPEAQWHSTGSYMFSLAFAKTANIPFRTKLVERAALNLPATTVKVYKKRLNDAAKAANKVILVAA